MSVCVIVLAGRASSIVDSRDHAPPPGVTLNLPVGYVAMSPVSRTLDALSLLSNPQTIWLLVVITIILLVRVALERGGRRTRVRLLRTVGGVLLTAALLEAVVILAPRPMAELRVSDPERVRVDFHSHTQASDDTNQRFSAEDNREWHRSGGFDIAYITDHVRFGGVVEARPHNPQRAGEGVSLISGVEGRYHKILSTIMLGLYESDTTVLDRKGHLLPGTPSLERGPVTIVAIPNGNIDSVTVASIDSLPHFAGMELVDAAPRGLGQLDREEEKIRRIARDTRLILVASSNNHGWGRTVAAWSLMTIPGWRSLPPDSVGRLIERPFRERQLDAVTIVKRLRPRTHGITTPLTLPVLAYQVLGSLTWAERGVWLVWIWGVTLLVVLLRGSKQTTRRGPDQK